jgi:hypothetical protein
MYIHESKCKNDEIKNKRKELTKLVPNGVYDGILFPMPELSTSAMCPETIVRGYLRKLNHSHYQDLNKPSCSTYLF